MIDFLKYRPFYTAFSAAIFAVFIGALVYKHQTRGETFVYSVDFTGGTQVVYGFDKPVASSEVVGILEKEGYHGVVTREFSDKEILVRLKDFSSDAQGLAGKVKETLESSLGTQVEIKQVDSVGSGVGASFRWKSLQAIVLALLVMLLYTWWRFWALSFGLGVLISLLHDAVVILAFFLLFDYEISLYVIGSILVVLGYSINDTIVVFSRVRENIKKLSGVSMDKIVNISINETLRRTLLTSFATTLTVIALLMFGGESLRTMSLALLVGFVFGTYSSIYIAAPVMLFFYRK